MTCRELKRSQPRAPVKATVGGNVFVGVPEGAVVTGVDGHAGVIAPAAETARLRASTNKNVRRRFHATHRVARNAASVAQSRVSRAAGLAEPQRNVTQFVHADARHPESESGNAERALLENFRSAIRAADFIPAHRGCRAAALDRVHGHQRLVIAKIPVSQAEHQAIAQGIQLLRGARLRNTGSGREAGLGEGVHGDRRGTGESSVAWSGEVHMELEQVQCGCRE